MMLKALRFFETQDEKQTEDQADCVRHPPTQASYELIGKQICEQAPQAEIGNGNKNAQSHITSPNRKVNLRPYFFKESGLREFTTFNSINYIQHISSA